MESNLKKDYYPINERGSRYYFPKKRLLNFYFWYNNVQPLTDEQLELIEKIILDRTKDGK